mmetsp:Transcript_130679/g.310001  ORF Transcript_130679/g.310001 Transcript_130679/m.310001 type:complete len:544 (-) Transcript_130679:810-2441(-)
MGHDAVSGLAARLHVADARLVCLPGRGAPAGAGVLSNRSNAEGGATIAAGRTLRPGAPQAPLPVLAGALAAGLCVAGANLNLVAGLAALAARLGHVEHESLPVLVASAAAAAARSPTLPGVPHAVAPGARLRAVAGSHLPQVALKAAAAQGPLLQDTALPPLFSWPAGEGTATPVRPVAHLRVPRGARRFHAAAGLHELCWALLAAELGKALDLPLAPGLALTAGAVAGAEGGPLGHAAVHLHQAAGLSLSGLAHAGLAAMRCLPRDALVAVHHVVQVAGAPGPPLPQQAVHRLVTLAAAACRAGVDLPQGAVAGMAAAMRVGLNVPLAGPPSISAGGRTGSPLLPVAEHAGLRHDLVASGRLIQNPEAGLPAVPGVVDDAAAAVPLAGGLARVATATPGAPLGHLAVLRREAVCRTALRALQRPGARGAALVVHVLHHPAARAQALAGRLLPLAPGAEGARDRDAVLAVVGEGTLCLVHLCPCTLGRAVHREEDIRRLVAVQAQGSGDHRGGLPANAVAVRRCPGVPSAEELLGALERGRAV